MLFACRARLIPLHLRGEVGLTVLYSSSLARLLVGGDYSSLPAGPGGPYSISPADPGGAYSSSPAKLPVGADYSSSPAGPGGAYRIPLRLQGQVGLIPLCLQGQV